MKIFSGKLGAEGQLDVDLVSGTLAISAKENTPGIQVTVSAAVPLTYFIDQGAQKMNSPLGQSIAALLDGVLKGIT